MQYSLCTVVFSTPNVFFLQWCGASTSEHRVMFSGEGNSQCFFPALCLNSHSHVSKTHIIPSFEQ